MRNRKAGLLPHPQKCTRHSLVFLPTASGPLHPTRSSARASSAPSSDLPGPGLPLDLVLSLCLDCGLKTQLTSHLRSQGYSCSPGYQTRAEPAPPGARHLQSSPSSSPPPWLCRETLVFKDIPPARWVPPLCGFKAFFCAAIKGCEKTWKGSPGWYRQLEQGAICARGRGGGGRAHTVPG